jgi:hypothetical protein
MRQVNIVIPDLYLRPGEHRRFLIDNWLCSNLRYISQQLLA